MTEARTSLTHPLRIDAVECGSGLLGITFCPGKCSESIHGARWERDLATDLDVICRWGASAIVTLVEEDELKLLCVPDLGAQVRNKGLDWYHLPIVDLSAPGPEFEAAWPGVTPSLRATLLVGGRVVVHCRGGLGRAGTVAACMLVETGIAPEEAIRRVRSARPGAIETVSQQQYVRHYRARHAAV
jgi:protein-tyrosine phosphatase